MSCCLDNCLVDGPDSDTLVLFAHGAGAGMSSDFMATMAAGLADNGLKVVRFNFGYMQANALDGKRRPPDRAPKLLAHFQAQLDAVIAHYQPRKLVLMGKSMGGRMAAILAATTPVSAVVCLGYPFVPLKGGEPRLAPLNEAWAPLLVVQGERDAFGNRSQVAGWSISDKVEVRWLPDGDHSFKPRKSSGTTQAANIERAIALCSEYIGGIDA